MRESFRILGVLLTVVVLWMPAVAVAVDDLPPGGTFFDDDADIHEGFIEAIAAEGITRGCNPPLNTHYCPGRAVTRGEMAAFLTRALDLAPSALNAFVDDAGSIFEADINALAAAGITKGCNPPANTMFCPDATVTRAQMAAFLTRALDLAPSALNAFVDDAASIFEADIDALAAAGITKGCNPPTNNEYCPDDPVKRDQMASLLGRGLGLTPTVPPERPDEVPGMLWSVSLETVDKSLGWDVAFSDIGLAAAGGSSAVFFAPVGGRWVPTELVRTTPDFEEAFPLGVAASGNRVAVTGFGHTPVVYVFEKVGDTWVDERIALPYDGGFDGLVAMDGDRIVARWGPLQFVELKWNGVSWDHCLFTFDVVEPVAGPGPIALDGDVIAFGDPYGDAAYCSALGRNDMGGCTAGASLGRRDVWLERRCGQWAHPRRRQRCVTRPGRTGRRLLVRMERHHLVGQGRRRRRRGVR